MLLLLSAMSVASLQAADEATAQKMNQANTEFAKRNYSDALQGYQQVIADLSSTQQLSDSLYYTAWMMVGRCHNRMENVGMAIDAAKQAKTSYEAYHEKNTMVYSLILDNLAFYYNVLGKFAEAEPYSDEAVQICYDYFPSDPDMKAALIHAAEVKDGLKKYDEAIRIQQNALNIMHAYMGEHSQEYVEELKFLMKYQSNAGKEDEAKQTQAEIERLEEEIEYGYVPVLTPLETAEKCREHRVDAYYCCKYYLHHYLSGEKMPQARQYITMWSVASDEVSIKIGTAEGKWMSAETGPYMVAYLAGCIIYALENAPEPDGLEQYADGIVAMLNYYNANKETTGEVPAFEEYLQLHAKDPELLKQRIEQDYEK